MNFTKFNLVQPYLADLHQKSEARVATNQDFNYIQRGIEDYEKVQADKTATLNEEAALKERKEIAAKKMARDKELAKQAAPDQKIFELTVENAAKPGLPSPLVETNSPANISDVQLNDEARLDEAEHVLEDYISLFSKNASLAAIP